MLFLSIGRNVVAVEETKEDRILRTTEYLKNVGKANAKLADANNYGEMTGTCLQKIVEAKADPVAYIQVFSSVMASLPVPEFAFVGSVLTSFLSLNAPSPIDQLYKAMMTRFDKVDKTLHNIESKVDESMKQAKNQIDGVCELIKKFEDRWPYADEIRDMCKALRHLSVKFDNAERVVKDEVGKKMKKYSELDMKNMKNIKKVVAKVKVKFETCNNFRSELDKVWKSTKDFISLSDARVSPFFDLPMEMENAYKVHLHKLLQSLPKFYLFLEKCMARSDVHNIERAVAEVREDMRGFSEVVLKALPYWTMREFEVETTHERSNTQGGIVEIHGPFSYQFHTDWTGRVSKPPRGWRGEMFSDPFKFKGEHEMTTRDFHVRYRRRMPVSMFFEDLFENLEDKQDLFKNLEDKQDLKFESWESNHYVCNNQLNELKFDLTDARHIRKGRIKYRCKQRKRPAPRLTYVSCVHWNGAMTMTFKTGGPKQCFETLNRVMGHEAMKGRTRDFSFSYKNNGKDDVDCGIHFRLSNFRVDHPDFAFRPIGGKCNRSFNEAGEYRDEKKFMLSLFSAGVRGQDEDIRKAYNRVPFRLSRQLKGDKYYEYLHR